MALPSRRRKWFALTGLGLVFAHTHSAAAPLTERIVSDWRTGLALYGFDPVTYFTGPAPAQGRADMEYAYGGVTWRFSNEGNRAAFSEHPDVYMPQFGGYDPIAVAQGTATAGHPALWVIRAGRLYVFHSPQTRQAFIESGDHAIAAAEKAWPQVVNKLIP